MQVNSIQSTTPNFGMALKITPEAKEALKKMSVEKLEKIGKIGEELKGHQYVDVVLGKNAEPVIKTPWANAYSTYFKPQKPTDEFFTVETKWAGTEFNNLKKGDAYKAVYDLASKDAAIKAYEKMQASTDDIERAAEFAKVIEERSQISVRRTAEERAKLDVQKNMTDDLFKQFGCV